MALSVRTRFEVFKRDEFTCKYCGRKSPAVVLEVDHIIAVADGGTDDPINLTTSCWDCNRGKSDVPLGETITGEDPHDRAILLLERERQLREYNVLLAELRARRVAEADSLFRYWCEETGSSDIYKREYTWLVNELERTPMESIRYAMDCAVRAWIVKDLRYVMGVVRNMRGRGEI